MSVRRSRIGRGLRVLASIPLTTFQLSLALWRNDRRWLIPLAVVLGMLGLLFVAAVSVEALAPFVYTLF